MGILEWINELLKPKPATPATKPDQDVIEVLAEQQCGQWKAERDQYAKLAADSAKEITAKNMLITDLQLQLASKPEDPAAPNPAEEKWNNKYPKSDDVRWTCKYIHMKDGSIEAVQVDPRIFFQPFAGDLKGIAQGIKASLKLKLKRDPTYDEMALAALQLVRKNIKYTSDIKVEGVDEYWQEWCETWELKTGDCEDGSILLANIMMALGIPYWRIRLNAGDVNGGGHAYVTYCRQTDDEFVVLDWCYWPNDKPVSERALHKDEENYSGHSYGIWWSWNVYYVFKKMTFLEG